MKELTFNSCTLVDKKLYFISNFDNMITYMDIESGQISYLRDVKGYEPNNAGVGIEKVMQEGEKIYFFTIGGEKVLIYDIKTNSFKTIYINLNKKTWGNYAFFTKFQNELFIFPSYGDNIVKINTITDEVIYERNLYEELKIERDDKFFACGCRKKDYVYLFGNQFWVEYNLLANEYKIKKTLLEKVSFTDVINFENDFYLLEEDGRVYKKNISSEILEMLIDIDEGEHSKAKFISTQKKLWILPALGEEILIIDYASKAISIFKDYPMDFRYNDASGWSKYLDYCKYENKYYIAMRRGNYLLVIDDKTGEGRWIKPIFPDMNDRIQISREYKIPLKEDLVELKEFINAI